MIEALMMRIPVRALAAAAVAAALALAPAAASAQIAGVLARPRPARPARDSIAGDSAARVGRAGARVPAEERQRLDIQAWVDSAAGALAAAPPAPIPAPGTGSIFNAPAVPDSLRPPAPPVRRAAPRPPRRGGARPHGRTPALGPSRP